VSRFRDDARDIAQVLDVWLDLVAAGLTTVSGVIVLFLISPTAAAAIVAPIIVVLVIGHLLAARLRAWRWAEREATAGVTGFIGDAFGAIATVVAAAEAAVLARFGALRHSPRPPGGQGGTQLAQTLGGITANAGLAWLILVAPP
jgi:ATP-binding cassette subfamily B protein